MSLINIIFCVLRCSHCGLTPFFVEHPSNGTNFGRALSKASHHSAKLTSFCRPNIRSYSAIVIFSIIPASNSRMITSFRLSRNGQPICTATAE
uniref:Putative secreted protein n=1 Tax=Anopheles darlingi TaxID=43151 RepID=A0A2M4DMZ1_ANODA